MTKSKKQFAAQQAPQASQASQKPQKPQSPKSPKSPQSPQSSRSQTPGTAEEFGRTMELTFVDHPWPASRTELLEHASRQRSFAKTDFARLKQIPHRDYHSVADLMQATREVSMSGAPSPGPVATAEHNRRAMDHAPAEARISSAAPYDEQMH